MRWITKTEPEPNLGDRRVVRCFAWRRMKIGDYAICLEWYEVHQRYFMTVEERPGLWIETSRQVT